MQRVRKIVSCVPDLECDGSGVNIAVLDTGFAKHPDMAGAVVGFLDFVGNRSNIYDNNGHGTHVCGILCGNGKAEGGKYRGMAPGAKLLVGKVLDEKGDGSTEAMLKAVDWILQEGNKYNVRIVNISVGMGSLDDKKKERALRESVEELWNRGYIVVCAAGNKGPGNGTISSVGGSNRVITVGCHDGDTCVENPNRCELYSGWGRIESHIIKPDVVAPGTDIYSCNAKYHRIGSTILHPYIAKSGTSMATPVVAGALALLLQQCPDMSNEECKQKLQLTATDMYLPKNVQGWGMLNVSGLLSKT